MSASTWTSEPGGEQGAREMARALAGRGGAHGLGVLLDERRPAERVAAARGPVGRRHAGRWQRRARDALADRGRHRGQRPRAAAAGSRGRWWDRRSGWPHRRRWRRPAPRPRRAHASAACWPRASGWAPSDGGSRRRASNSAGASAGGMISGSNRPRPKPSATRRLCRPEPSAACSATPALVVRASQAMAGASGAAVSVAHSAAASSLDMEMVRIRGPPGWCHQPPSTAPRRAPPSGPRVRPPGRQWRTGSRHR
jgi:hypothetical protein